MYLTVNVSNGTLSVNEEFFATAVQSLVHLLGVGKVHQSSPLDSFDEHHNCGFIQGFSVTAHETELYFISLLLISKPAFQKKMLYF